MCSPLCPSCLGHHLAQSLWNEVAESPCPACSELRFQVSLCRTLPSLGVNVSLLICLWLGHSGQACEKCLSSARVNRWSAPQEVPLGSGCALSISTARVPGSSPEAGFFSDLWTGAHTRSLWAQLGPRCCPTWPHRRPGQLPHLSFTARLTFHLFPMGSEAPRPGELCSGFVHIRNLRSISPSGQKQPLCLCSTIFLWRRSSRLLLTPFSFANSLHVKNEGLP